MDDTIDLVIPVYKPDKKLKILLERIQKQTVKPRHIYLMHTKTEESNDSEKQWLGCCDRLTVVSLKKEEFDHGGTRNQGAMLSDSPYLLFMTQDAVPANRYLIEELVKGFQADPQGLIGAVYGRQLPLKSADAIEQYTRYFNYPVKDQLKSKEDIHTMGIKTYFCSNVCAMYRKEYFNQMGGFTKNTIFNEDMILAAKMINAGYKIYYASRAKVYHSHHYTCWQQFQRNFDLAVSQKQNKVIFQPVRSESEGIRLVWNTASYLWREKKALMLPDLILKSGFKFLGFKMGSYYDKLPKWLILKLTMNPSFWQERGRL